MKKIIQAAGCALLLLMGSAMGWAAFLRPIAEAIFDTPVPALVIGLIIGVILIRQV